MYLLSCFSPLSSFFFFNDTATTEIYTLSLHDALPIWNHDVVDGREKLPMVRDLVLDVRGIERVASQLAHEVAFVRGLVADRKSTRLNSSHSQISYAVFCLKKKNARMRDVGIIQCMTRI